MAGIFQNGVFSMGFDMDPTAAQVFTGLAAGSSSSTTPFSFGYSWYANTGCTILFNTTLATVISGQRFYLSSLPGSGGAILISFYDATSSNSQVTLRVTSTGQLQFYLGAGTGTPIGSPSAAGTVVANTWVYIEALVTISATVGVVTCNVNGTQVITATGQNTKNTSNTYVNALYFAPSTGLTIYIDDWYMLDTTGTSPLNTFLGPVQVRGDAPNNNSAVSGRNAWTPTNPTNVNHSNVANIPASSSEYNADNNPGDYDMFRFPSLPSNVSSVLFVNEWALLELDSSGARTVELNCYSNGTDSPTSAFTPAAGTPTYYNQVSTVDPHTSSAWTVTNAGAAELGVKVQS